MRMLNIGDKVKVTILPQGSEGTIVATAYDHKFYVVEFIGKDGEPFTYTYEAHELIKVNTFLTKCECGAQYTWAPSQHSHWCPRWSIDS